MCGTKLDWTDLLGANMATETWLLSPLTLHCIFLCAVMLTEFIRLLPVACLSVAQEVGFVAGLFALIQLTRPCCWREQLSVCLLCACACVCSVINQPANDTLTMSALVSQQALLQRPQWWPLNTAASSLSLKCWSPASSHGSCLFIQLPEPHQKLSESWSGFTDLVSNPWA